MGPRVRRVRRKVRGQRRSLQERREGRGGAAFDDESHLPVRIDHRPGDVLLRDDGDPCNGGTRPREGRGCDSPLEPFGERLPRRGEANHGLTSLEGERHDRRSLALHTPHGGATSPGGGPLRLPGERPRQARRQPAATERSQDDARKPAEGAHDLEAERSSVAGDHVDVVVGGQKGAPASLGEVHAGGLRVVVVVRRGEDDLGAVGLHALSLGLGHAARHHDGRPDAQHVRSVGDACAVVARARRDDVACR